MGFFSWITQDTNESILNCYCGGEQFPVFMLDDKGNVWEETSYGGYGIFGGKDYYELVAEMNADLIPDWITKGNPVPHLLGDRNKKRELGIKLDCGISGIRNKVTGQKFYSSGIDFFNWQDERLQDELSANELLQRGDWETFREEFSGLKFPNLVRYPDKWIYTPEKPKDCPYQGHFI